MGEFNTGGEGFLETDGPAIARRKDAQKPTRFVHGAFKGVTALARAKARQVAPRPPMPTMSREQRDAIEQLVRRPRQMPK